MSFTTYAFLSGIFSNIILIIGITASISVIIKYYKNKKLSFLLFSITIIVLMEPWMPSGISFIVAFFNYGEGLPVLLYIFIGNAFIPIGLITWAVIFTDLIFKAKQKRVILLVVAFSVVYEIQLLIFLFTNHSSFIGEKAGPTDIEYHFLQMVFLSIVLIYILITGIIFGKETLKSNDPDLKLKGKLMIVGFISFVIFGAIDSIITVNEVVLVPIRILGIFAAFTLYGGFFLPKWMKKLLQKSTWLFIFSY